MVHSLRGFSNLSGQHFIAAAIPQTNDPMLCECGIDIGISGKWIPRTEETDRLCPYPGIAVEYFLWLSAMLNFTFEVRRPTEGSYGKKLENGSWDGVVGMLANGQADLTFQPIFITVERTEVIDYGLPVYDRQLYGFMYKTPSTVGLFSALYPLNWAIYTAIIVAFAVVLSAAYFLSTVCPRRGASFRNLSEIIWTMLEMDAAILPARFPLKVSIVIFSWFLVVYNLSNAYRSNLVVSAITSSDQLPLTTLDDAIRLIRSNELKLVVPADNLAEFHNVLEGLPFVSPEYKPWADFLTGYEPEVANNSLQMAEYLSDPRYAFFGDMRQVAWFFVKEPNDAILDIVFVKTPRSEGTDSLGFRKHFPFREDFTEAMTTLMSDVMMKQLMKKYFPDRYRDIDATGDLDDPDKTVIRQQSVTTASQAVTFQQLLTIFAVWATGSFTAFLMCVLELVKARWWPADFNRGSGWMRRESEFTTA